VPSANKHLRNAERHFRAAEATCKDDETRSWAAVALFYSAHQLVHAVLDGEPLADHLRHPDHHSGPLGTSGLVARFYRHVAVQYKSLFGTGEAVRYSGQVVTQNAYDELLNNDFEPIRQWAAQRLRDAGRTQLPDFLA
jgi:hypothetical protein